VIIAFDTTRGHLAASARGLPAEAICRDIHGIGSESLGYGNLNIEIMTIAHSPKQTRRNKRICITYRETSQFRTNLEIHLFGTANV
jgi:hypothetical protein